MENDLKPHKKEGQDWPIILDRFGHILIGIGLGVYLSKFKFLTSVPGTVWDGVPAAITCLIGTIFLSLSRKILTKNNSQ